MLIADEVRWKWWQLVPLTHGKSWWSATLWVTLAGLWLYLFLPCIFCFGHNWHNICVVTVFRLSFPLPSHWCHSCLSIVGASVSGKSSFIDTFWERIFRPTLGTLITDGKGWVLLNSIEDICWQAKIYIGNWRNGKLHGESDRCMVVVMQSCNSFTIWYCPDCNKADEGTTDEFSNYHFCQQQACGHSDVSTFFLLPCVMQSCTFKLLYKMKQASFWHSFDWTLWLQLKGCVDESCCSRSLSSNNKCG